MTFKKLMFLLLLIFFQINIAAADQSGFDEICHIYTEALNSSMKGDQLNNFINDSVKSRVTDKNAKITHDAITQARPDERYKIFKDSAEHYLNKRWACPDMKTLMK